MTDGFGLCAGASQGKTAVRNHPEVIRAGCSIPAVGVAPEDEAALLAASSVTVDPARIDNGIIKKKIVVSFTAETNAALESAAEEGDAEVKASLDNPDKAGNVPSGIDGTDKTGTIPGNKMGSCNDWKNPSSLVNYCHSSKLCSRWECGA